jgi:hypothetical protein
MWENLNSAAEAYNKLCEKAGCEIRKNKFKI